MKLDSQPLNLSGISLTTDLPESKHTKNSVSLLEHPDLDINSLTDSAQSTAIKGAKKPESALMVFGTTFITIFLAEIGDKTQLSTLLMSAESHLPWVVFLGSASALIATSLLSVLLGSWIANRFSPKIVEISAGMMLLFISVMLFWDVFLG